MTKTHSRPHVSNDNPYSEAQFKTLKYRPGFPDRFGSTEPVNLAETRQSKIAGVPALGRWAY